MQHPLTPSPLFLTLPPSLTSLPPSLTLPLSLSPSLTYSFTHLPHSFLHSITHSSTYSSTHLPTHSHISNSGTRTSVKDPNGARLPVRWAHREAIITLTGPLTTREVADEIATAVVLECYRNALLERLALRELRKHGAAAGHFSRYIQPSDQPRVGQ